MKVKNRQEMKAKIQKECGTIMKFADMLGMTYQGVQNTLGSRTPMNKRDVIAWCALLNIEDKSEYFEED